MKEPTGDSLLHYGSSYSSVSKVYDIWGQPNKKYDEEVDVKEALSKRFGLIALLELDPKGEYQVVQL